jgi:HeH/LEM domain
MDDPEYLQPGFDPNTLKVAELRGILLEHNVDYPSTAKKAQLVELFTQNVMPKARRILGARTRVRASTRGIIDADSDGTPPVEPTPRRSSRRATRMGTVDATEGEEDDVARPTLTPSPRKRSVSAKRASVGRARASETNTAEPEEPRSARKTRNSASRASILPEAPAAVLRPEPKSSGTDGESDEPVFSSYNPFQSGYSPAIKSPDKSDRRKVRHTLFC